MNSAVAIPQRAIPQPAHTMPAIPAYNPQQYQAAPATVVIPGKKENLFSNLSEDEKRWLRYTAYALGGMALAGGLFFAGRAAIRKIQEGSVEKNSLGKGDPSAFAKQLKKAFENDNYFDLGTDEDAIYKVFSDIPSQEVYRKVQKAYRKRYHNSLEDDLSDELTSEEYDNVMAILATKPGKRGDQPVYDYEDWVSRLRNGFEYTYLGFSATDEEMIYQVLNEVPNKTVLNELRSRYKQQFNEDLDWRITDEMSGDDLDKAQKLIRSKH